MGNTFFLNKIYTKWKPIMTVVLKKKCLFIIPPTLNRNVIFFCIDMKQKQRTVIDFLTNEGWNALDSHVSVVPGIVYGDVTIDENTGRR